MEKRPVQVMHTTLHVGAETPFKVVHISDSHLSLADERDDQRKRDLAVARGKWFPFQKEAVEAAKAVAKKENARIVCTGDLIDFVSFANLDAVKEFVKETGAISIAGNHEFSLYIGESKEDEAYRNQSLSMVEGAFGGEIRFVSRIINGINFVGIDNGYYQFDMLQLERLKREVEKGYPIVLFMHIPLYEPQLFHAAMYDRPSIGLKEVSPEYRSSFLVGVSKELMKDYAPGWIESQLPTQETLEVVKYINSCPQIKAILTGHLHCDWEGVTTSGIPQIITACTTIRVLEIE